MASIKANQYRIGNLMRDGITGALLRVDGLYYEIQNERIDYYLMDRDKFPLPDGWHAEPIPLTEEWLKKAGFVTMDYEIDYIEWGIQTEDDPNCERFHIIQDGSDEPFFFEYDLGFGDHRIEIKYVHQLQNLYFACECEELKFNL